MPSLSLREEIRAAQRLTAPERRQFMRMMAASLALAGLAGCDDDDPHASELPPARQQSGQAPGRVLTYASSSLIDGFANGVMVTTRDGRPIKIEGNATHPWSRGGTDAFGQASVLGLYDPYRSQTVKHLARDSDWQAFRTAIAAPIADLRANGGAGLHILLGPSTSPSLSAQLSKLNQQLPNLRIHTYAAVDRSNLYAGTERAFGHALETHWNFAKARVLVSLDGDILDAGPQQVGAARQWADARRSLAHQGELLALHAVASLPSLTSARADFAVTASRDLIEAMAQSLLAQAAGQSGPDLPAHAASWCVRANRALSGARGAGIVCAGIHASTALQEATQRLNAAHGNVGATVLHTDPVQIRGETLPDLTKSMADGEVHTLLMLGCNPSYDAPGDLDFTHALARVPLKLHAGQMEDETALQSDWHLPLCHPLESWDDARALDGTPSLIQPTIAPLYDGKTIQEILSLLFDPAPFSALSLLHAHWQGTQPAAAFKPVWRQALLEGVFQTQRLPTIDVAIAPEDACGGKVGCSWATHQDETRAPPMDGQRSTPREATLAMEFRPDPTIWDGTFANNAWLQELPKPLTKIVWENAIAISPALAKSQNLVTGDIAIIECTGHHIEGPVWISSAQADDVIGITLGYGRQVPNQLSAGLGYDANILRSSNSMWRVSGATLRRTGEHRPLATTEEPSAMAASDVVRVQAIGATPTHAPIQPSLYQQQNGDTRAWGMVIDLDSCIGCNACITACQAENNIAVVGRDQVLQGRAMHWLRVDRYESANTSHFMPVPCMHCEQAPCEVGCPVEATLHDSEGLNLMVYNRCIGTRACSGYCPYKVRKFNYFDYAAGANPSLTQQYNPDVTVRSRGVMEKCTFCVQRIAEARVASDLSSEPIHDGAVRTACQGACPTSAITFGDLADANSKVAAARADARSYALLEELNTKPRTTYLSKLTPSAEDL
jgi:molybdopterin-containing oxidoreductase family iron-sulfur binding subunit